MAKKEYSISVLLPTRGRTEALGRSVKSLFNRAVDLDKVQIIFGFDEDDAVGQDYFIKELQPWLDEKGVNYTAMQFAPMTYAGLNRYYNAMAEQSDAEWLFIWNDDAVMETSGWDRQIIKYNGQFRLLKVHTHNEHPYSIFPIVPSEWFEKFGYFSRHQMVDAELSQIAYYLDLIEIINVYVLHDRLDLTGNNDDETERVRVRFEGNPNDPRDFHHQGYFQQRTADTEIIAGLMKEKGLDTTFWENVKTGKQDPWEKLKANDPNKQMTQSRVTTQ